MQPNTLPPLLLCCVFLLWGWQISMWFFAVLFSVVVLLAPKVQFQFTLASADLHRIVDILSLVFVAATIYVAITYAPAQAVFVMTQWLPVILFPLLAVQYYSNYQTIPLSALSMHMRKNKQINKQVDLNHAFFVLCLIAASTGNQYRDIFFIITFLLLAWYFWVKRNARFTILTWLMLMPLLLLSAHQINQEIGLFQRYLEQKAPEWYLKFFSGKTDPYHRSTDLGYVGELKLSDQIMMRVTGDNPPSLLRVASYNYFAGDYWSARTGEFKRTQFIQPPANTQLKTFSLMMDLEDGEGILPLPIGTQYIWSLPAEYIAKNPMGAVKVKRAPSVVKFNVAYDPAQASNYAPTENDLRVPSYYHKNVDQFIEQYQLRGLSDHDIIKKVDNIFTQDYRYTLHLTGSAKQPVNRFLSESKEGHCEFFATASVLILRRLGIPTRYAFGYSVQEYSDREGLYVVRAKHAHAWAVSFVDGLWTDVDTTPPDWSILDGEAPSTRWLSDLWSWLLAEYDQWQMEESSDSPPYWLAVLLIPLLWLLRQKWQPLQFKSKKTIPNDHPLQPILIELSRHDIVWQPGETLAHLVERACLIDQIADKPTLLATVKAYYQYRYCDQSTSDEGFQLSMAQWLSAQQSLISSKH